MGICAHMWGYEVQLIYRRGWYVASVYGMLCSAGRHWGNSDIGSRVRDRLSPEKFWEHDQSV